MSDIVLNFDSAAEAKRQRDLAAVAATEAVGASEVAVAAANFRATIAEGIADFAVGAYFSSKDAGAVTAYPGETRTYKRTAVAPYYEDQGDEAAPVTKTFMIGRAPVKPSDSMFRTVGDLGNPAQAHLVVQAALSHVKTEGGWAFNDWEVETKRPINMLSGVVLEQHPEAYIRNSLTLAQANAAGISDVNRAALNFGPGHPYYFSPVAGGGAGTAYATLTKFFNWKAAGAAVVAQDKITLTDPTHAARYAVGKWIHIQSVEHFTQYNLFGDGLSYIQPHGLRPHLVLSADAGTGIVHFFPPLMWNAASTYVAEAEDPPNATDTGALMNTLLGVPLSLLVRARLLGGGLISDEFLVMSNGMCVDCEWEGWVRGNHAVPINAFHDSRVNVRAQGHNHLLEVAQGSSNNDITITGGFYYAADSSHPIQIGENSINNDIKVSGTFQGQPAGTDLSLCYLWSSRLNRVQIRGRASGSWYAGVSVLGAAASTTGDTAATTPLADGNTIDFQVDDRSATMAFHVFNTADGNWSDGEIANRENTFRGRHLSTPTTGQAIYAYGYRNKFEGHHEGGKTILTHATQSKELDFRVTGSILPASFKSALQSRIRSMTINGKVYSPAPYVTSSASTNWTPDMSKQVHQHTATGASLQVDAPLNYTDAESSTMEIINGSGAVMNVKLNTAYWHAQGLTPYQANATSVTQTPNKGSGVTSNNYRTLITTSAGSLAAGASVVFQFLNTLLTYADSLHVELVSGFAGARSDYDISAAMVAGGIGQITIRNTTGGALAETLVLNVVPILSRLPLLPNGKKMVLDYRRAGSANTDFIITNAVVTEI